MKRIICAPTIDMCNQIGIDLEIQAEHHKASLPFRVFAGKAQPVKDIVKWIANDVPGVAIISHEALKRLPETVDASGVELFVDELPSIIDRWEGNYEHTYATYYSLMDVEETHHPDYYRVVPGEGMEKKLLELQTTEDDGLKHFRWVAKKLLEPHWQLFVRRDCWLSFYSLRGDKKRLSLTGVMVPTLFQRFKNVCFLSAGFEVSLMRQIWERMGISWSEHPGFNLPKTYSLNQPVSIHYFIEHETNILSISFLDTISKRYPFKGIYKHIKSVFGSEPYIWSVNNKFEKQARKAFTDGTYVNPDSRGLNGFMDQHNICYLSTRNPPGWHMTHLRELWGIDEETFVRANLIEDDIQAIMRTSLRDRHSTHPVKIIVGSRYEAEKLADILRGATTHHIPHSVYDRQEVKIGGRPSKHKSEEEKKAARREVAKRAAAKFRAKKKEKSL